MSSSAAINSGKFSGHKSNFSQTCAMLSQYVKNNGSFGDLNRSLSSNFHPQGTSRVVTTHDFLAMIEKSGGESESEMNGEAERAQMTIFYDGQVMVFDDFPADKAQQIMGMASSSNAGRAMKQRNQMLFPPPPPQALVNDADMPIVRKASLARFFQKRKDRITARAPYQLRKSIAAAAATSFSGPVDSSCRSSTWLSLAESITNIN